MRRLGVLLAGTACLAAGCQVSATVSGATAAGGPAATSSRSAASRASNPNRTITVTDNTWTDSTNPAAIALGDGKYGLNRGDVDSCQTSFPSSGGATSSGSWLDSAAGTWDSETKPVVEGSVTWSKASYSVKNRGTTRVITTDDLPKGEPTGTFPISPSDPAYQYDQNPNTITRQKLTFDLPRDPTAATKASCTSLGPIGVMDDGVVLLNALDAEGRDAGAHELLDKCDGHPMMAGMYHYHMVSSCIMPTAPNSSTLVGYALDGYGIYVERNAAGNLPTDADLDACHGRTSMVLFNGKIVSMYHYDATLEYPYTVGCYEGTPAATAPMPPD
jgi:hypothetical protein